MVSYPSPIAVGTITMMICITILAKEDDVHSKACEQMDCFDFMTAKRQVGSGRFPAAMEF